nr:hypothetical protein [Tanacetum cinerariifolium]
VVCLPNEEIFAGLAQMRYEKPSTKLTFYKAFFSSQWKFLIHTILESLSAKRTSWNEFSTAMASVVICLSKGQRFNFSKYIFDSLIRNVDSSSKFYMYPHFIQLIIQAQVGDLSTHTTRFISPALTQKVFANMKRVVKGFSGVETPLFEDVIADRQPAEEELGAEQVQVDAAVAADVVEDITKDVAHVANPSPPPHGISSPPQEPSSPPQQPHVTPPAPTQGETFPATFQQVLDTCSALLRRVEHLEHENVAQRLEIVKLKARVKKLEQTDKVKPSKFRRLRKVEASRQVESSDDMEDVFKQGWMMNENEGIDATIPAAAPIIVAAYTRRRKGVIIRDLEEELPLKTPETPAKTPKVKDKGNRILVEALKPMKKKDQIEMDAEYARKLQEEIDRDHDGFNKDVDWDATMDHVNQKSSNGQDAIWRNQKSVHGLALVKRWKLLTSCGVHVITLSTVQLFLLVERRYPLSRFTLEQLVNIARL